MHMRWLKGDLEGAIAVMEMAARAGSPRNPEPAAWAYTRLALYELQVGASQRALQACDVALDFQNNYAPALLVRGRILLSENQVDEAVEALSDAATLNPLPEYQWALAEALRAAGRMQEAHGVDGSALLLHLEFDPMGLLHAACCSQRLSKCPLVLGQWM